jgi:hypothetical protein
MASNYSLSTTAPTTLADVTQAALTYTATVATRAYGVANPTFSGNVIGFVGSDNVGNATTGTLAWNTTAASTSSVGSYPITGSGLSASNYTFAQAAGNSTALTVSKANATINVSGYTGTYDALAHGATGSATGAFGETLSGLALGGTYTNVPGGSVIWTYTDATGNYNDATNNVSVVINKANPTVTVTPYSVTYDGAAHTASGSATGVGGVSLSGLSLTGTTHTNAGSYSDSWTFTDVTGNYNNTSGSANDAIAKAAGSVVISNTTQVHDGTPKSVTTSTTPSGRTVDVTYNGSATAPSTVGSYAVVATINDTNYQGSATGTLQITNTAPVANAQSLSTLEDTALPVTLTATDAENDTLTYSVVASPAHGTLSGSGANLTYTPSADYNGSDSFTFKANDGYADSATKTVSITVTAVNDVPSFTMPSTLTKNEDDGSVSVASFISAKSSGPSDESGQTLNFIVSNNNNALFSVQPFISATGTLYFKTATDQNGAATVSVQIHDNGGTTNGGVDTSSTQTFTLTLTSVNDAPVLAAISNVTANEQTLITFNASATDVENDTLAYSIGTTTAGMSMISSTGAFSWTPTEAQGPGIYTFSVNVSDGNGGTDTKSVTITVDEVNVLPTVNSQSVITDEDTPYTGTVTGSDVDIPVQTLTYAVTGGPSHGTLTSFDASTGAFTYAPAANYFGTDSFDFRANDGVADGATSTVSITINSVNDVPTITLLGEQPLFYSQNYNNVSDPGVSATDVEDGTLADGILQLGTSGNTTINVTVVGSTTITYTVTDSNGATASVTRDIITVPQLGGAGGSSGIVGCMDPTATNYNAAAGYPGSCSYPQVLGAATSTDGTSIGANEVATTTVGGTTGKGMVLGATKYNFTRDLRTGSRGDDVMELQKMLAAEGFFTSSDFTKYFGALTKAGLVKWQGAHQVKPTSGFFGPLSRKAANQ